MNTFYRLGGVLLCLHLSGCAGMHLYSEKRDQQGKDLKAAWAKVDLPGYFASMHEQRKKLLKADLDAIGGARSAEVDSALMLLLDSRVGEDRSRGTFYGVLDEELDKLGTPRSVKFVAALTGWKRDSLELQENRARQIAYRKLIKAEGAEAPACTADQPAGDAAPKGYAAQYLAELAVLCRTEAGLVRQQDQTINALPPGTLRTSGQEAARLERQYAAASLKANTLMAQYRETLKTYSAAVRANRPSAIPSEEMDEAGARVRKALAALADAHNALGNEALADDRVKRIDAILARLGTTDDPGKDATRAELAAVLVTRIANDAQVLAELNKPLVPMSLLIRRDLEKNRADLARVQADLYRKDIELVRAAQASRVAEAFKLLTARNRLSYLKDCYRSMSFLDAVAFPVVNSGCDDPESRAELYGAAGEYLFAIGNQRARTLRLEQLRRDVKRERQLAYAQANAEQWAVLIDATAGQAAEYAATGQKISNYKDIIQALSLIWIGQGVNQ